VDPEIKQKINIKRKFSKKPLRKISKKNQKKFQQKVYGVIVLIGLLLAVSLWFANRDTASPRKVLTALLRF